MDSRKRKRLNLNQCSRDYFEKVRDVIDAKGEKKIYYRCNTCNKELNGTTEGNLVKHLRNHPDILQNIEDLGETIEKKRLKLLLDCVELVTVNGNAFNRLLDSGLLSILDKTLKELESAGKGVNLKDPNLPEVKQMLDETATSVKQKICDELIGRPLTLMVDGTTKRRRSILGVSVQFIKNGQHVIRSIGMVQLHESHTGEYLASVICNILSQYNIEPHQIIAITTDNGANVLKMVRDLSSQIVNAENEPSQAIDSDIQYDDAEIENYLLNVPEMTDEQALEDIFDMSSDDEDNQNHENLLNAVVRNVQREYNPGSNWNVEGIHCAVHTLQLCIKKALSKLDLSVKNAIGLCRCIAKFLRLNSTAHELNAKEINFTVPRLDVVTRWCSTYAMVVLHFIIFTIINICLIMV